jgi:hypothetical protein
MINKKNNNNNDNNDEEKMEEWKKTYEIPIRELFKTLKGFTNELFYTCTYDEFAEFLYNNSSKYISPFL